MTESRRPPLNVPGSDDEQVDDQVVGYLSAQEIVEHRALITRQARNFGLSDLRVDQDGTLVVHSERPGYVAIAEFVDVVSRELGAEPYVVSDDAPMRPVGAYKL